MNRMRIGALLMALGIAAAGSIPSASADGDDEKAKSPAEAPSREQLEAKLKETLTGAVLTGRWRLVKDGALGEEREEKYTIQSVVKAGEDLWIILARIQYGGKDLTVPVPVAVKWAGDTPVISVTNAGLPGLGTYTARVMIYEGIYTGVWSGPGHGGLLSGSITRPPAAEKEDSEPGKAAPGEKG